MKRMINIVNLKSSFEFYTIILKFESKLIIFLIFQIENDFILFKKILKYLITRLSECKFTLMRVGAKHAGT